MKKIPNLTKSESVTMQINQVHGWHKTQVTRSHGSFIKTINYFEKEKVYQRKWYTFCSIPLPKQSENPIQKRGTPDLLEKFDRSKAHVKPRWLRIICISESYITFTHLPGQNDDCVFMALQLAK